jgi:nucleoside-diphosphate-sugar epimerase
VPTERDDDRPVGRLLVTGVPGWLTAGLFASLSHAPLRGLTEIRCLVQPGQQASIPTMFSGIPVDFVQGDLLDAPSLRAATAGVDTVMHAAGVLHVRRTNDFYEINTRGTQRLLEAALDAKVQRFVLISSNAAAGRSTSRSKLLTEADPARPLSHYGRSKLLAEEGVLAARDRMEVVVSRPCMFYGPPVPARHVEVYQRIRTGRMPLVGSGDYARSLTYIDSLVQGTRLALVRAAARGQVYYISDAAVYTTKRVVEAMAAAIGVEPRFLPVPGLVGPLAYATDVSLARLGVYWQTVHLVGESDWHVGVTCAKARDELGYAPMVEIEEGMRRAVDWCRANGYLAQASQAATVAAS